MTRGPVTIEVALARLDLLLHEPADTGTWWTTLARGVGELTDAIWEEQSCVGGPEGLHRQLVEAEPRLTSQVRRLETELTELIEELSRLRLLIASCMGDVGGLATVTAAATLLVARIRCHRRRGSTLMHEAYQRDLGGGD